MDARGTAALEDSRHAAPITWAQREEIANENWALLEQELLNKHLEFTSRPYEAHVQFSTFCNMSCIMCWNGQNPPLRKMSPRVLERVEAEIAPTLSVITPYEGSEPLIVSWDETRDMARRYSIQLALTTNTQFLDAKKFDELKDIVEMIVLSIDSHIPEVFEKIRPGSKPEKVFQNLKQTVRLCEQHGIECMVQAVLMTENAPMMPETIAYMAEIGAQTVNVIQMIDVNKQSGYLDPTLHFSADWMEWMKQKCISAAKEGRIRLGWWLEADTEWFDFREPRKAIPPRESKVQNDDLDHLMKLRHPGFCKYAYNRLRITADGDVSPCGMATEGELHLGSLQEQHFEEIWNGSSARDLRRAHFTWDYPSLCKSCRLTDPPPPKRELPFLRYYLRRILKAKTEPDPALVLEHPSHMARLTSAPSFVIRQPEERPSECVVLLALGGERDDPVVFRAKQKERNNETIELELHEDLWGRLETNLGYWWTVVGLNDQGVPSMCSSEIRCLIRHEEIARIEGSTLGYPDQGHLPAIYLGGSRQVGWQQREALPVRPRVSDYSTTVAGHASASTKRSSKRTRQRAVAAAYDQLVEHLRETAAKARGPASYTELVLQLRELVRDTLPADASPLIISRGDSQLLELDDRNARHFPSDGDLHAGHHPPDDGSAISNLEKMRGLGADYLLIPSTEHWWLSHYEGFAGYLNDHYSVVLADHAVCTIFDLRGRA